MILGALSFAITGAGWFMIFLIAVLFIGAWLMKRQQLIGPALGLIIAGVALLVLLVFCDRLEGFKRVRVASNTGGTKPPQQEPATPSSSANPVPRRALPVVPEREVVFRREVRVTRESVPAPNTNAFVEVSNPLPKPVAKKPLAEKKEDVRTVREFVPTTHITTHGAPLISQSFDMSTKYNVETMHATVPAAVTQAPPRQKRDIVTVENPKKRETQATAAQPKPQSAAMIFRVVDCPEEEEGKGIRVENFLGTKWFSKTYRQMCINLETDPVVRLTEPPEKIEEGLKRMLDDFLAEELDEIDDNTDYTDPNDRSDQAHLKQIFNEFLDRSKKGGGKTTTNWVQWMRDRGLTVKISFDIKN